MKIRFSKDGRMVKPKSDEDVVKHFNDLKWYDIPAGFVDGESCKLVNDIPVIMTGQEITDSNDNHKLLSKTKMRCKTVKQQTENYIKEGFIFENVRFSLDQDAQLSWIGILYMIQSDRPGINSIISFPYSISGKDKDTDETVVFNIADEDHYESFFLTGMVSKEWAVKSGTALEIACQKATTMTELNAVKDDQAAREVITGARPDA